MPWSTTAGRMVVTNNQSIRSLFGNIDGGVTQESCSVAGIIIGTPSGGGNADQHDVYILKGGGDEVWEPKFTNHGFRYVEVRYAGTLDVNNIRGRVVHQAVNEDSARAGILIVPILCSTGSIRPQSGPFEVHCSLVCRLIVPKATNATAGRAMPKHAQELHCRHLI